MKFKVGYIVFIPGTKKFHRWKIIEVCEDRYKTVFTDDVLLKSWSSGIDLRDEGYNLELDSKSTIENKFNKDLNDLIEGKLLDET